MKNKLTLLFLVLALSLNQKAFSQLEAIGSTDYGRIFNITYDPSVEDKLYATSLLNHILVSHDNGKNWEVMFSMSAQDVSAFKDLKLTRNNTALSFIKYNIGSGDNTILILDIDSNTIIDEVEIPYNSDDKYVKSYSIYPNDPNVILMNTRIDFGVLENTYYTIDGGQNWDLVYTKSENDNVAINDVAINPINPEHLILTRGSGPTNVDGGLFLSTDGGQTWTDQLPGVVLSPVTFNPHNPNIVYTGTGIDFDGVNENLYRSTDGGENWQAIPIAWTHEQLNQITVIEFNPHVENSIMVLEENQILISTDNGITWENNVHDANNIHGYYYGTHLSFNPFNEEEVFINSDWHPQFSDDGGTTLTWAKNNFYLSTGSLELYSEGDGQLYYGVQYGYVNRNLTTEAEESFDILPLDWYTQGDGPSLLVDETMEGRIFTFSKGWFGSNLKVSIDHGQTKHQILSTSMRSLDATATNPFDSSVILFSFSDNSGNAQMKRADVSDLNSIVTSDITLPENGVIKGIHFDPLHNGHIIITLGTKVYKSGDYGDTWNLSNSGLELLDPVNDLILHLDVNPLNSEQLSIATNKGVYTSLDGGETWSQIYNSLVHQIHHSNLTEGHLVGMIHSSQVSEFSLLYSKDAGQTWDVISSDELLSIVSVAAAVKFNGDDAEVYIGSFDLGLLKYTIDLETLGIDSYTFSTQEVSVFPNPTKDEVTIKVSGESPKSVAVIDITGKHLFEIVDASKINMSVLPSGIYLLKVLTDSGEIIMKRVIKE